MVAIPPPRYRVIERGRRLEVIDTRVDEVPPPPATGPSLMAQGPVPPQTSRALAGDAPANIVLVWTALIVVTAVGLAVFDAMGFAGLGVMIAISAPFWRRIRPVLDRWLGNA
jgi:hypothetical protein